MVTEHFISKGKTGLSRWQIESVIRNYMGGKTTVEESEYETIETLIRRKEVGGMPGSKVSPRPTRGRNTSLDRSGDATLSAKNI